MLALINHWKAAGGSGSASGSAGGGAGGEGLHEHVQSMQLHYKHQKEYMFQALRTHITDEIGKLHSVMCYIYIDSYMLIIVYVLSLLFCIQARIIIPQLVCFSGLH